MRTATRATRSSLQDGRQFWTAMAVLLGAILTALGLIFATTGSALTASSRTYVVVEGFGPGGLNGHGYIWLVLGLALVASVCAKRYSPKRAERIARATLIVISLDLFWTAFALGLAGQAGGKTSWVATVLFIGLALWPITQVVLQPRPHRPSVRLRAAMIREGLTPAAADRVMAMRSERSR